MITLVTVQEDTPESNADDQEEEAAAQERKPAPQKGRRGREMIFLTSLKKARRLQREAEGNRGKRMQRLISLF